MSDSDDVGFSATQTSTSASEDEGQQRTRLNQRESVSRRAPLTKRPSLQKRKKPTQIRRSAGKAADPFDDADLFKPSETMEEEMNAMKQVFLRMSEKKFQQKEERKAECKRLYKEAFRTDVEQIFRKAAKSRSKIIGQVSNEIEDIKTRLKQSSEGLMDAHNKYKTTFKLELTRAEGEIEALRANLSDLELRYIAAQKNIEVEYEEVTQAMDTSLQQLEIKLIEAYEDKSFFSSFRPHIERLL